MRIGALLGVVAVLAAGGAALFPRLAAAGPIACESLLRVPLTNGTIISAESVPAGAFAPPPPLNASAAAVFSTLPAFCRVTARLTPTSDSDIRIEVWLPLSGWNRKVQAAGNGGLGGTIPYPGARGGRQSRLCRRGHGHGPRRRQRRFRAWTSREARGLRLSRDPRDDRVGQDGRGRALRCAPGEVLLQLVLDRRAAGARSRRSATRRTSTASWPATRPGIRCGSTPHGSP